MAFDFLQIALAYHRRGWRIHPVQPREKKPILSAWSAHAYANEGAVIDDWDRTPQANIGLICGPRPQTFAGDTIFVAIDCDGVQMLDRATSVLPATPAATISGSGDGGHLIYRWNPTEPCPKKCTLAKGEGKHSELGWYGGGGQIVLPASIHPSLGVYRWQHSDNPFDIPELATIPIIGVATLAVLWPKPVERPRVYLPETVADLSTVRMSELARSAGIYRRDLGGGKHAVICPWVAEHTSPDYSPSSKSSEAVVFDPQLNKPSGFHCFHGVCEGRRARDFMAALGIGLAEQHAMATKSERRTQRYESEVARVGKGLPWKK